VCAARSGRCFGSAERGKIDRLMWGTVLPGTMLRVGGAGQDRSLDVGHRPSWYDACGVTAPAWKWKLECTSQQQGLLGGYMLNPSRMAQGDPSDPLRRVCTPSSSYLCPAPSASNAAVSATSLPVAAARTHAFAKDAELDLDAADTRGARPASTCPPCFLLSTPPSPPADPLRRAINVGHARGVAMQCSLVTIVCARTATASIYARPT